MFAALLWKNNSVTAKDWFTDYVSMKSHLLIIKIYGIIIIIIIIIIYGIYIALYPVAQSALQHFVGDYARLLI